VTLDSPPESLAVSYDLHGVRCEVRPQRMRPLWLQALYALWAGGGMLLGVLAAGAVGSWALWTGDGLWFVWLAPVLGWWAALVWLFAMDRARQVERLEVRVGEGWLIIRHRVANLLDEVGGKRPDPEVEMVVTEVERIDLRECLDCRVIQGPVLRVQRLGAEPVQIPMRSHTLDEIGWLAGAIQQGIRDARHSEEPAPVALLGLLATEGVGR